MGKPAGRTHQRRGNLGLTGGDVAVNKHSNPRKGRAQRVDPEKPRCSLSETMVRGPNAAMKQREERYRKLIRVRAQILTKRVFIVLRPAKVVGFEEVNPLRNEFIHDPFKGIGIPSHGSS